VEWRGSHPPCAAGCGRGAGNGSSQRYTPEQCLREDGVRWSEAAVSKSDCQAVRQIEAPASCACGMIFRATVNPPHRKDPVERHQCPLPESGGRSPRRYLPVHRRRCGSGWRPRRRGKPRSPRMTRFLNPKRIEWLHRTDKFDGLLNRPRINPSGIDHERMFLSNTFAGSMNQFLNPGRDLVRIHPTQISRRKPCLR